MGDIGGISAIRAAKIKDSAVCATGGAASGKTEFLVRKAAQLISDGLADTDICMIAESAAAVWAIRQRLNGALDRKTDIQICTVENLCKDILDLPSSRKMIGREIRIATKEEEAFFAYDLRAAGFDSDEIAEAFKALGEKSPITLSDSTEQTTCSNAYETLVAKLLSYDVIMARELASLALFAFDRVSDDVYHATVVKPYMLVDDCHNLSVPQRKVCASLAGKTLIAAGDFADSETENSDPSNRLPAPSGFERFSKDFSFVRLVNDSAQGSRIRLFSQAIRTSDNVDFAQQDIESQNTGDNSDIVFLKWHDFKEEAEGLIDVVDKIPEQHKNLTRKDVFICAPSWKQAHAIMRSFAHRRKDALFINDGHTFSGDPRHAKTVPAYETLVKLSLAADVRDVMAWRAWCGLDRPDLAAETWHDFETWAHTTGKPLAEAIRLLPDTDPAIFPGADLLAERVAKGISIQESSAGKTAQSLMECTLAKGCSDEFVRLLETDAPQGDASILAACTRDILNGQFFAPDNACVQIGTYESLRGQTPKALIITSAVEGLMPSAKSLATDETDGKGTALASQRRMFCDAIADATEVLILSTFRMADNREADAWKLNVARWRRQNDYRLAVLTPTRFISDAGHLIPSSQSGEQYLSS